MNNRNSFISQLMTTIALRDKIKENLNDLESEIYQTEEIYLEETSEIGNIVKGFEQCSRVIREVLPPINEKRIRSPRKSIRSSDRIFSNSSVTWQPIIDDDETESEENDDDSDEEESQSASEDIVTPVRKLAPAKRLRAKASQDI